MADPNFLEVDRPMHPVDYAVLGCLMAATLSIGIHQAWLQRKDRTVMQYLLANRNVKYVVIAMSAFSTMVSPITMIGTPVEVYAYGSQMLLHIVFQAAVFPLFTHVLIPVYMNLDNGSFYSYFKKRYNTTLWKFCAILGVVEMTMLLSTAVYGASNVIYYATGVTMWTASILVVSVCVLYTAIGGMKAVIWTDFLQGLIIIATIVLILILGTSKAGGLAHVWNTSAQGERLDFFNFSIDLTVRHTVWTASFGSFISYVAFRIGNQPTVQRYMTARNLQSAQRAAILGVGIQFLSNIFLGFTGLIIYTTYINCDPIQNAHISQNQLVPMYTMQLLGPYLGLRGLFITGITAAVLSTMSSVLNALSTVTLQDLSFNRIHKLPEEKKILICQVLVIIYGGLSLLGIYFIKVIPNVLQAVLMIQGVVSSSVVTLILIGIFLPQINIKAVTIAEFTGVAFCVWIAGVNLYYGEKQPTKPLSTIGCHLHANGSSSPIVLTNFTTWNDSSTTHQTRHDEFRIYDISYMWFSSFAFITIVTISYALTICLGCDKSNRHRGLVPPLVQKLHCCLPNWARKICLCDVYKENVNTTEVEQTLTMTTICNEIRKEQS